MVPPPKRRQHSAPPITIAARALSWSGALHIFPNTDDGNPGEPYQSLIIQAQIVRHDSGKLGAIEISEITIHTRNGAACQAELSGYMDIRGAELSVNVWIGLHAFVFATQLLGAGKPLFLIISAQEFRYRRSVPISFCFQTHFSEEDYF